MDHFIVETGKGDLIRFVDSPAPPLDPARQIDRQAFTIRRLTAELAAARVTSATLRQEMDRALTAEAAQARRQARLLTASL